MQSISIVIPAKNEETGLMQILPELRKYLPDSEVLVVNDGSTDKTAEIAAELGARVISHPFSMGNGAAIKTGARNASGKLICFMDADGQHRPEDIPALMESLEKGFDMVVGARAKSGQSGALRGLGNRFYNWFSSLIVGYQIEDLTSGFRLVKAAKFREFLSLLPNKFSYPTTVTMAFFRAGYSVGYVPIIAPARLGESHLNVWRDGIRFLLIIFKIGTLYSPLKIFLPVAFVQFLLGLGYYLFTFVTDGRFNNMSALMFTSAVTVFLIGLVSEQITSLAFKGTGNIGD